MKNNSYSLRDFLPLTVIACIIIALSSINQFLYGWDMYTFMNDFMGFFFVIFGGFKIYNIHHFAQAYATYDILAMTRFEYAYLYPFIELTLGISYLLRWYPLATNWVTLCLMLISALGVFNVLLKEQRIPCACLGMVFVFPMTYVTLFEDLLMALMAGMSLYNLY